MVRRENVARLKEADVPQLRGDRSVPLGKSSVLDVRATRDVPDMATGLTTVGAKSQPMIKGSGTSLKNIAVKALGNGTNALLAAAAAWDVYEQIKEIPSDDPEWHEKATRLVAEAIASYGLPIMAMYLGAIAGGMISGGPGSIPGAVAGLAAGALADIYLGDSAQEIADELVDKLFDKTSHSRAAVNESTLVDAALGNVTPMMRSRIGMVLEAESIPPIDPKLAALLKELGRPQGSPISMDTLRRILRSPASRRTAIVAAILGLVAPTELAKHDTNSLGDQAYRFAKALGYDNDQSEKFARGIVAKGPDSPEAKAVTGETPVDPGVEIYTPKPGELPPMPGDNKTDDTKVADTKPTGAKDEPPPPPSTAGKPEQPTKDIGRDAGPIYPWPGFDPKSEVPTSTQPNQGNASVTGGQPNIADIPADALPSPEELDAMLRASPDVSTTPKDEPESTAAGTPNAGDEPNAATSPKPAVPYDINKSFDDNLRDMFPNLDKTPDTDTDPSTTDTQSPDQKGDQMTTRPDGSTTGTDLSGGATADSQSPDSDSSKSDETGNITGGDQSNSDSPGGSSASSQDDSGGSGPSTSYGSGSDDTGKVDSSSSTPEPNLDHLTFKQAFARARERARQLDPGDAGKYTFTWRGKEYQTNYQGSGTASSPEEPYIPKGKQKGMMSTSPITNPYENPGLFGGKTKKKSMANVSETERMRSILDVLRDR